MQIDYEYFTQDYVSVVFDGYRKSYDNDQQGRVFVRTECPELADAIMALWGDAPTVAPETDLDLTAK